MDIPSAARMYDYLLGGSHNFPDVRPAPILSAIRLWLHAERRKDVDRDI